MPVCIYKNKKGSVAKLLDCKSLLHQQAKKTRCIARLLNGNSLLVHVAFEGH